MNLFLIASILIFISAKDINSPLNLIDDCGAIIKTKEISSSDIDI
jgi:hypothetical protein